MSISPNLLEIFAQTNSKLSHFPTRAHPRRRLAQLALHAAIKSQIHTCSQAESIPSIDQNHGIISGLLPPKPGPAILHPRRASHSSHHPPPSSILLNKLLLRGCASSHNQISQRPPEKSQADIQKEDQCRRREETPARRAQSLPEAHPA